MSDTITLTPAKARTLILDALTGAGTAPANAAYFADAILDTELSGLSGHGFYWLPAYCEHVRSGKVDGKARPSVKRLSPVAFRADARFGFAHPAIEKGFEKLVPAALKHGIAGLAVHNSYNAATLGYHTGYLAKRGLLAFGFTNSPAKIAPVGGRKAVVGTNPMSFAVPGKKGRIAFLIDQSSSAVAWSAVRRAADAGRDIPLGWALDKDGNPTTDPVKGLEGTMAPSGGYKGFGQGLIVEVMCAALTGSKGGLEMGGLMGDHEHKVGNGQFFIALEPRVFSGGLFDRQIARLVKSIVAQPGCRMPNARREANIKRLRREGLTLDRALHDRIRGFAE